MGMVSYTLDTLPPVSKEDLDAVAALRDEDIDCSDIPELTNCAGLRPKPAHEPEKAAVTVPT
ncbi:MAG: hypothetical protein FWG29_11530 [Treponema sp.]|nr:hypothetical protein [Treponema sp.]